MIDSVLDRLREIEQGEAARPPLVNRRVTPLEFLEAVYHNENLPLPVRLRAAIEAAPFKHPKLSATLAVSDEGGFAARLERALKRSGVLIEHRDDEQAADADEG